jgi:hypothetical protein
MTALVAGLRTLTRLFVDDGALALAIIAVVLLAAGGAAVVPERPMVSGALLLAGCLAVLSLSVVNEMRKPR